MEFYRTLTFGFVIACWIVFALIFLLRKRPVDRKQQTSAPASRIGVIIEACAYALVWSVRRIYTTPFLPIPLFAEAALLALTCAIAAGSIFMTFAAVRTLGKQWSVVATVIEGHELITTGPYRFVRNPIYAGMFGMLIATGISTGHWQTLLIGGVLFLVGTIIRIRSEEKILRAAFGAKFDEYSARVSALLPGLF